MKYSISYFIKYAFVSYVLGKPPKKMKPTSTKVLSGLSNPLLALKKGDKVQVKDDKKGWTITTTRGLQLPNESVGRWSTWSVQRL